MTITVYSFEDRDGNEHGCFTTQDYKEALSYASRYRLRIVANDFEWSDREFLDDFTGSGEEEDENDETGADSQLCGN